MFTSKHLTCKKVRKRTYQNSLQRGCDFNGLSLLFLASKGSILKIYFITKTILFCGWGCVFGKNKNLILFFYFSSTSHAPNNFFNFGVPTLQINFSISENITPTPNNFFNFKLPVLNKNFKPSLDFAKKIWYN